MQCPKSTVRVEIYCDKNINKYFYSYNTFLTNYLEHVAQSSNLIKEYTNSYDRYI